MDQSSSNVADDVGPANECNQFKQTEKKDHIQQITEAEEEEASGNTEIQDQFWKIFQSSKSYWDSYLRTSSWLNQHCTFVQEAQRSSSRYDQWCRSQMSYHALMANFFYSQWLHSQSVPDNDVKRDDSDSNKLHNCQNLLPGHCAQTPKRESKKRSRTRKSSKRNRSRRNKRKSLGHSSCHIALRLGDDDPVGGGQLDIFFDGSDNSEFEMEITEEMLQFFNQSAKHREERDSMKTGQNIPGHDFYVELSEVNAGKNKATTEPPKERPGLRRIEEMKELYGSGAAMIHGMETAMQLTFDRNSDRKQPRPWPALPIDFNMNHTRNAAVFVKAKAV